MADYPIVLVDRGRVAIKVQSRSRRDFAWSTPDGVHSTSLNDGVRYFEVRMHPYPDDETVEDVVERLTPDGMQPFVAYENAGHLMAAIWVPESGNVAAAFGDAAEAP